MPFIEVILQDKKLSREQKQNLVEVLAGVMKQVVNSRTEQIRIVLHEISEENLFDGSSGRLEEPGD
ncbi:tautomerase family protein [Effusibacillus lacus]|uniref:4-oxalocrotonate tautomerase n=1 Tax=Effusibacillus lacus TaxID=1348429 RepID=A0A292YS10_9BACL|nr:tautomerase family protein [Effusibacillus lacus]TCS76936.1 4-oxalocrotonate tautomerase family enzyme [Effusibacillus lacus]GAX91265.1 4-oxalocrotonate tautomerase [Effusibacillus lacus]